jgi:hypothetical protein
VKPKGSKRQCIAMMRMSEARNLHAARDSVQLAMTTNAGKVQSKTNFKGNDMKQKQTNRTPRTLQV